MNASYRRPILDRTHRASDEARRLLMLVCNPRTARGPRTRQRSVPIFPTRKRVGTTLNGGGQCHFPRDRHTTPAPNVGSHVTPLSRAP